MKPITRLEHFLAKIARDKDAEPITPTTRTERYLNRIAEISGALLVNFSRVGDELEADRSIAEIAYAMQSGRNVVAVYSGWCLPLSEFYFQDKNGFRFSARFQSIIPSGESINAYTAIYKNTDDPDADNVWTIDEL